MLGGRLRFVVVLSSSVVFLVIFMFGMFSDVVIIRFGNCFDLGCLVLMWMVRFVIYF